MKIAKVKKTYGIDKIIGYDIKVDTSRLSSRLSCYAYKEVRG